MPERAIGDWRYVGRPGRYGGGTDREYHAYEHAKLPITVQAWGEADSWHVNANIRGSHEHTIAGRYTDRRLSSKDEALGVLYDWMRRNPHPARLATADREMREREARRMADRGAPGDVELFDQLG
jgi:hypothetical protein